MLRGRARCQPDEADFGEVLMFARFQHDDDPYASCTAFSPRRSTSEPLPKVHHKYQAVRAGVQHFPLDETDHAPMSALLQEDYQAARTERGSEGSTVWAALEDHRGARGPRGTPETASGLARNES